MQELIDSSKHAKLEAERDMDPRSRTRARIAAAKSNQTKVQPLKKVNLSNNNTFLDTYKSIRLL